MQTESSTTVLSAPITNSTTSPNPSYTILRIKRKRNEEPLDALVVESRLPRKKSRGAVGLFQYAQTVEDSVWDDATRQKSIQDEISRLARETAAKAVAEPKAGGPSAISELPASPTSRISKEEAVSRRYTIVNSEPKPSARRNPVVPPTVYPSKELEARKNARDFKMYDAVRQSETAMNVDEPSDMDKFLPMLNDYLNLHDVKQTNSEVPLAPAAVENKPPKVASDDEDYVWDVFYHRPATLTEWNAAANSVVCINQSMVIVLASHLPSRVTTRHPIPKKSSMKPMKTPTRRSITRTIILKMKTITAVMNFTNIPIMTTRWVIQTKKKHLIGAKTLHGCSRR
ncbi:hypothetical protein BDN70DRAFT_870810 [Pholiota conissans]|uniref:Uncharacterized protein n=1 Tax=Pholiota conissans TaxID=109636 RepID=A0A9P5ZDV1_9AGAR|nr:hypothetical protein BDN70DRAFT_870810 [Pholiota conissans]